VREITFARDQFKFTVIVYIDKPHIMILGTFRADVVFDPGAVSITVLFLFPPGKSIVVTLADDKIV